MGILKTHIFEAFTSSYNICKATFLEVPIFRLDCSIDSVGLHVDIYYLSGSKQSFYRLWSCGVSESSQERTVFRRFNRESNLCSAEKNDMHCCSFQPPLPVNWSEMVFSPAVDEWLEMRVLHSSFTGSYL